VLLNIFDLYRLPDPDDYYDENGAVAISYRQWWYKLAHVCRLWRNLILESPSRLDLHLFCTVGVPVADMLAHSPPLPLTISYEVDWVIQPEDESGIFLALSHRDRVRHIYLCHVNMEKFVRVMDDQFPVLERMYIESLTDVALPVTFQAPNLRHITLVMVSLPIGSPLLTTTPTGLVTLSLRSLEASESAHFTPSYILGLSLLSQLENLFIGFRPPFSNHDIERQRHQTLNMITLPNLRWFCFSGPSIYLEVLVARIRAPSLNKLHVHLFDQPPFIIPPLLQFVQTSKNLRFTAVQITFGNRGVSLHAVPFKWDTPLLLRISRMRLNQQVASAVEFFRVLSPVLSVVEDLTLSYQDKCRSSSQWHNVDRSQWCELLGLFTNAKAIHVKDDLACKIFPSGYGELPGQFLPNLEEIGYSGGRDVRHSFTIFLKERQLQGRPVSLRLVDPSMFYIPLSAL
jgi:hypothetical protein